MVTTKSEIEAARGRVTAFREAYDKAVAELQRIEREPLVVEPGVGGVIRFEVRFGSGARTYTYIGLRTPGGWFLTGDAFKSKIVSWDELWDWITRRELVKLQVATRWSTKAPADDEIR